MAMFRSTLIHSYALFLIALLLIRTSFCLTSLSSYQPPGLARFALPPRNRMPLRSAQLHCLHSKKDNKDDDQRLNEFLDTPFFDPDKVLEDENETNPLLNKLARFVKEDYDTFEALYVGAIFVVLVILSQELLRMSIYGDKYVPFTKLSDKLF